MKSVKALKVGPGPSPTTAEHTDRMRCVAVETNKEALFEAPPPSPQNPGPV